ncbi:DASH complex subunit DAD1 [Grifola frondosa]|uniref:DASH complex subunit DAD1 n=1 Tax=Grifola frondosa TaxID=5627 RepID=A0A1C7LVG3_GRIFR|nr:DASH complex subunit DAD1 [Grifola frondosa]
MEDEGSFFERERDRLTGEITSGFEELLSSSNNLNRKLEEVLGMTREYETIAALWRSFHELMRGQKDDVDDSRGEPQGLPGTGGHIITIKPGSAESDD